MRDTIEVERAIVFPKKGKVVHLALRVLVNGVETVVFNTTMPKKAMSYKVETWFRDSLWNALSQARDTLPRFPA